MLRSVAASVSICRAVTICSAIGTDCICWLRLCAVTVMAPSSVGRSAFAAVVVAEAGAVPSALVFVCAASGAHSSSAVPPNSMPRSAVESGR